MTSAAAVPTSPEQRERALATATDRRDARRDLRLAVKAAGRPGASLVADAILTPDHTIARAYVWRILRWIPRVGDATTRRLLTESRIDPWARAGRLTEKQRTALAMVLRAYGAGEKIPHPYPRKPGLSNYLPVIPFREWLWDRHAEAGTWAELAAWTGVDERTLRRLTHEHQRVSLGVADRCLTALGEHLSDLYPDDEACVV